VLLLPLTIFGVTILIFLMLFTLGPVQRSALYVRDIPHTEGALDAVIRRYGLDRPIYEQYWNWLVGRKDTVTGEIKGGVLRGDFGYSRTGNQPVVDLILHRLPATAELARSVIPSSAWACGSVFAAVNHCKPIDRPPAF
jgi:peptide/nickel transport system permease protein